MSLVHLSPIVIFIILDLDSAYKWKCDIWPFELSLFQPIWSPILSIFL
jgi:hypothetical protein